MKKSKYLGYTLVNQEMGSDGYGEYCNYAICEGNTPEEVVRDWCKKVSDGPTNNHIFEEGKLIINDDETFIFSEYFTNYFLKLPDENITCRPRPIILITGDYELQR